MSCITNSRPEILRQVAVCIGGISSLAARHDNPLFDFIESCLRNKHEMVIYEAASAIIHLPNCTARELAPAVSGEVGEWALLIWGAETSEPHPWLLT